MNVNVKMKNKKPFIFFKIILLKIRFHASGVLAKASKEINAKYISNILQSNFNSLLFRTLTAEKLNAKLHTYIFNLWINYINEIAF